jgi:flagellar motor switch protein FliG
MAEKALKGTEKVAAFLLSLDGASAVTVLKHLPDYLVAEIAESMTTLDPSLANEQRINALFKDIATRTDVRGPVRPHKKDEMKSMLQNTFGPERANRVLLDIETRNEREFPFRNVERYAPQSIAAVLRDEAPSVAAVVLAHLNPSTSAAVLAGFEEEQAIDVVRRMTNMVPPGFETLKSIAADLETQLDGAIAVSVVDTSRQLKTVAEMLNYSGAELEESVLGGIQGEDEDKAREIKEYMFTWDDLASIEKRAMQKILGAVNTRTLSIALKAATADVEKNIMDNLSSRVRAMVVEERELTGPMPMSEVRVMRAEVMEAVRTLMDSGEFKPSKSGEDLVA